MKKKATKLPTAKELAFYRSKIEDNSYIGKNQLAAVFAALDAETERANAAEDLLKQSPLIFPAPNEIQRVRDFALNKSANGQTGYTFYDGVLATTAWILGELETAPDQ